MSFFYSSLVKKASLCALYPLFEKHNVVFCACDQSELSLHSVMLKHVASIVQVHELMVRVSGQRGE